MFLRFLGLWVVLRNGAAVLRFAHVGERAQLQLCSCLFSLPTRGGSYKVRGNTGAALYIRLLVGYISTCITREPWMPRWFSLKLCIDAPQPHTGLNIVSRYIGHLYMTCRWSHWGAKALIKDDRVCTRC